MDGSSDSLVFSRSLFGKPSSAGAGPYTPATVPLAGRVVSVSLNLITLPILGARLTRRLERVHLWSQVSASACLLLAIYIDSFLFIFVTGLLKHLGINASRDLCDGAILLCLVCYMSTKVLIYTFLVEKAWIVRGCIQKRMQSRLYLFNCFGMLLPYTVVVVLNFVWRIDFIDTTGKCIIGMDKRAMLPLIIFEAIVNIYLNMLFIIPLRKIYSYRQGNGKMKVLALRTFIGSCATLISSVVNLTVLMAVGGEPGWLCLMLCNADILFCVLVLHWATSFDSANGGINSLRTYPFPEPLSACTVVTGTTKLPEPTLQKRKHFSSCVCEDVGFPDGCRRDSPWEMPPGVLEGCHGTPDYMAGLGGGNGADSKEKAEMGVELGRVISEASVRSSDMDIRPADEVTSKSRQ